MLRKLDWQEGGGDTQEPLMKLLEVASVKFISSIAGIASSMLLSFTQKWRIKTFEKHLQSFCDLLEECTEYKSAEKLLHENNIEQEKHTLSLENMAINISEGVSDALSNKLPASVASALEPLANEIRKLVEKISENQKDGMENVLHEFIDKLRKTYPFQPRELFVASV